MCFNHRRSVARRPRILPLGSRPSLALPNIRFRSKTCGSGGGAGDLHANHEPAALGQRDQGIEAEPRDPPAQQVVQPRLGHAEPAAGLSLRQMPPFHGAAHGNRKHGAHSASRAPCHMRAPLEIISYLGLK
jgi:hypothetical protein